MRDFWKPMPVSGKLIRELLLLFLLLWVSSLMPNASPDNIIMCRSLRR